VRRRCKPGVRRESLDSARHTPPSGPPDRHVRQRQQAATPTKRRHTPEQIIRKLREADRLLGEGAEIADVVRHLEVSEQTHHRWRNQFGGMKADDAKRLRELERENAALKRIVADKELENLALREIAKDAPIDQVGW
jgi:putative transposase